MKIAMLGTRGVPAAYGGFETAVEEIGSRLAAGGHEIVVYCRNGDPSITQHRGMQLVHLPAVPRRSVETLSHTALSVGHLLKEGADAAFVFNVANAPLLGPLKFRSIPCAINVDGIEWRRSKWGKAAKTFFKVGERVAVRSSAALISDAQGIADYYRIEHSRATHVIAYGAPQLRGLGADQLAKHRLDRRNYHLAVARFEPENNLHTIVEGYTRSSEARPLVIVGDAPYSDAYKQRLQELANNRDVRFLGRVDDQDELDQLYFNCSVYIHGHTVGGTNPSLLRALGAGAPTIVHRNEYNLEVAGPGTPAFSTATQLAELFASTADHGDDEAVRQGLRDGVAHRYNWDDIARSYESLALVMTQR